MPDPKNNEKFVAAFLVSQNATLKCSLAKTTIKLKVLSHNKYQLNNNSNSLLATIKENDIAAINFKLCYRDTSKPIPCKPNVEWIDTYSDALALNTYEFLLDISKGICQTCLGNVSIEHHGQWMTGTAAHLDNMTADTVPILMPFGDALFAENKTNKKPPTVNSIEAIYNNQKVKGGNNIKILVNDKVDFKAIYSISSKQKNTLDEDLISWQICRNVNNKFVPDKTYIKLGKDLTNYSFPKEGIYTVEGYDTQPGIKNRTITIVAEKNTIAKIVFKNEKNEEKVLNIPYENNELISFQREKLLIEAITKYKEDNPACYENLKWTVKRIIPTPPKALSLNFGDNSWSQTVLTKQSVSCIDINFRTFGYGVYILSLKDIRTQSSLLQESLIKVSFEILPNIPQSLHLNGFVFRPNETIIATVKRLKENQEFGGLILSSQIIDDSLVWKLESKKKGKVGENIFFDEEGHYKGTNNGPTDNIPDCIKFSLPEIGTFSLEVKLAADLSQFRFKSKLLDSQTFSVKNNFPKRTGFKNIVKLDDNYQAFIGESIIAYVEEYDIPDVWEIERAKTQWGVHDKDKQLISDKVYDESSKLEMVGLQIKKGEGLDECVITVNNEIELYIQAYFKTLYPFEKLGKSIQKIKIINPNIEDAFWLFESGEKINEAGVNQNIVYLVESKSFIGRSVMTSVWAGDLEDTEFEPEIQRVINTSQNRFYTEKESNKTYLSVGFNLSKEKYFELTNRDYVDDIADSSSEQVSIPIFFTMILPTGVSIEGEGIRQFEYEGKTHVYIANNCVNIINTPRIHYFVFSDSQNNRPIIRPIQFGEEILLSLQTMNMRDEEIIFELYLDKEDNPILVKNVLIDQSGLAEWRISTKKEWAEAIIQTTENNEVKSSALSERDTEQQEDINNVIREEDSSAYIQTMESENSEFGEIEEDLPILKKLYARVKSKKTGRYYTPNTEYFQTEKNDFEQYIFINITTEKIAPSSSAIDGLATVEWTDYNLRKKCPNCKAPITMEEIEVIVGKSNESRAFREECLRIINELREIYHIDTCARKAHFIAQICAETNLLLSQMIEPGKNQDGTWKKFSAESLAKAWPTRYSVNGDGKTPNNEAKKWGKESTENFLNHKYGGQYGNASNEGYKYRGRGLMHLTFKGKEASKDGYIGAQIFVRKTPELQSIIAGQPEPDFINYPDLVGENPVYATLTAIWFWVKSNAYLQADWGCEDDDAYNVRRITNGGFIGVDNVQKYLKRAKDVFKTDECPEAFKNRKNRPAREGERAPWMDLAFNEARMAKGVKEWDIPLSVMIQKKYHALIANDNAGYGTHWCAAFGSWILHKAGYPNPLNRRSGNWVNHSSLKRIDDNNVIYGTIVVLQNNYYEGGRDGRGHITFVVGIYIDKNGNKDGWVCLGGNQSDRLQYSPFRKVNEYPKYGYNQEIEGFYLPNSYTPTEAEQELKSYTYNEMNEQLNSKLNKDLKSDEFVTT